MNKIAYIKGFIKEASKWDKLLRAGKLSSNSLKRLGVSNLPAGDTLLPKILLPKVRLEMSYGKDKAKLMQDALDMQAAFRNIVSKTRTRPTITTPTNYALFADYLPWSFVTAPTKLKSKLITSLGIDKLIEKMRAYYDPASNSLGISKRISSAPESYRATRRHEMGHWAGSAMPTRQMTDTLSMLLDESKRFHPSFYKKLTKKPQRVAEMLGHYMASKGTGPGSINIQNATARNFINQFRHGKPLTSFSPGVRSAIEHMQRNYGLSDDIISQIASTQVAIPYLLANDKIRQSIAKHVSVPWV